MRFNVPGKDLQTQLQAVNKVISSKSALKILENFLLRVRDNTLYIIGSDQETVMTASLPINDVEGEGEIAISAKMLLDVVKEVNNQPLMFYVNEQTLEIEVKFNNGRFSFTGIDAKDYPRKKITGDETVTFTLPGDVVAGGLEGTIFAASLETIRPIMTGIFWDVEPDKITFVSSDTHKLVKYEVKDVNPGVNENFILPGKAANILAALIDATDTVEIERDEKSATFKYGSYTMSTRLIKGTYPNYKRVFPKDNPFELIVNRESLLNAVKRVGIFASKASGLIKFNVQPTEILMGAQDLDFATSAEERVLCEYRGNAMTIGFNSTYMIEVLANLKCDDIKVELADPARPGLFSPMTQKENREVVMLQMPMQVIE